MCDYSLTINFMPRWEDNIKMDLQEFGCGGECGDEPSSSIK